MSKYTEQVCFTIRKATKKEISIIAKKEGYSVSAMIDKLIEEALTNRKPK